MDFYKGIYILKSYVGIPTSSFYKSIGSIPVTCIYYIRLAMILCFGSSAMTECISKRIMFGRPFGGVAILVGANVAKFCQLIHKSQRFIIVRYSETLLVNVYMPCKSVVNYADIYCDTLNNISAIISCHVHASVVDILILILMLEI